MFHQYTSQFDSIKNEALSGVGTNIIFRVGLKDARALAPILQEQYTPEDLVNLKPYEAIARIGTEIIKFKTNPPPKPLDKSNREAIIQQSYNKYYKPVDEIKSIIALHNQVDFPSIQNINEQNSLGNTQEDFFYDEF